MDEKAVEYEAVHLRGNRYAVRPKGQLGTCGWHPFAWTVVYITAVSAEDALRKFHAVTKR